jgi:hypothetical protein
MSVRRTTHATVLGYQSPEEFERKSAQENPANFSGATVTFVVNDENSENQERLSPGVSGDEDSKRRPLPRAPSPATRCNQG